jgi:hypothetical protein
MPIATRTVGSNFDFVDHHTFITNEPITPVHIFQNANVAGMVGTIQQISLLAEYATEIFENLQKEVLKTNTQLSKLTVRSTTVSSQLPALQKVLMNKQRHCTETMPFKQSEQDIETNMLAEGTRPIGMQRHYTSAIMNRMPDVKSMDQYLTPEQYEAKGSSTTLYSHPNFFFFEWLKLEEAMMKKKQEEKRLKKIERQERRAKLRAEKERKSSLRNSSMIEKKKGLNWRERWTFVYIYDLSVLFMSVVLRCNTTVFIFIYSLQLLASVGTARQVNHLHQATRRLLQPGLCNLCKRSERRAHCHRHRHLSSLLLATR